MNRARKSEARNKLSQVKDLMKVRVFQQVQLFLVQSKLNAAKQLIANTARHLLVSQIVKSKRLFMMQEN